MRRILFPCIFIITALSAQSQSAKDSTAAISDSAKMAHFFSIAQYPVIKGSKWSGIIPVKDPNEIPDKNLDYKLLFEFTYGTPDSAVKEINRGLAEIGRRINLHVASGIPLNKIHPVVVAHGPSLYSMMKNESYQKKYHTDNPNLSIIKELENAGVKFIACGQAMAFFNVNREDLLPEMKVSLNAQTVLSGYQLKGYVLFLIDQID